MKIVRNCARALIRWIDPKYAITTGRHFIFQAGYRRGADLWRSRAAKCIGRLAYP